MIIGAVMQYNIFNNIAVLDLITIRYMAEHVNVSTNPVTNNLLYVATYRSMSILCRMHALRAHPTLFMTKYRARW